MQTPRGFVVVDKPPGMTSHDVVARVRRQLGIRRVGHGGTLDPMATGVLILGVGDATRLLQWVSSGDKCYEATLHLGSSTTTDDAQGELLKIASPAAVAAITEQEIGAAFDSFRGTIQQVPSRVSAIKVAGVRAYTRARSGEEFDLIPREVQISKLDWSVVARGPDFVDVALALCCSSGTYVRALARDIGDALGIGGHLTSLRRTRVNGFTLDDASPIEAITANSVVRIEVCARRILPTVAVDPSDESNIRHGRPIAWPSVGVGTVALLSADGVLLAVCHEADGRTRYDCVFA